MSVLSSIVSTAGQIAVFTTNAFSIGFRGLRIYQTYHDPEISNTNRWSSIALNTISIAAQTASCSSNLEDKQIEQLTAISNTTGFGADMIHVIGNENATITSQGLLILKFLSSANQARGGRKELSDLVHIAEAVTFCYENRNWIGEQVQELKNRSQKRFSKKKRANVLLTSSDAQKEYQKLISDCRRKYSTETHLNILSAARGRILRQEAEIEFNRDECQTIIQGKKITDFKKIPYILKDEFQDRICSISKKPIYKVVAIRESADSKSIYYEWSNLVTAIQNERVPKNWPKSVPFGPEATILDHLGTKNIQDRLKKAALKPNIAERARAALKQLDKQKEFLEVIKALSLADMLGLEIDEECVKLIDEGLLINTELKTKELRRD